jgi:probable HAF family extracellular repeat protein
MRQSTIRTLLLCGASTLALAGAADAQTFTGLGALPGATSSNAMGLSADGLVAAGLSGRAFRWSSATGMQDLGLLPGGTSSQAAAASADGAFITGSADTPSLVLNAFLWSAGTGMVSLGTLGANSFGLAISADGSVVAGRSFLTPSASSERAFRWTAATGMQDLGNIPNQGRTAATAISSDGSTIVGYSGSHPFRWTARRG